MLYTIKKATAEDLEAKTQAGRILAAIKKLQPAATAAKVRKAVAKYLPKTKNDPDGANRVGNYLATLKKKGLISGK